MIRLTEAAEAIRRSAEDGDPPSSARLWARARVLRTRRLLAGGALAVAAATAALIVVVDQHPEGPSEVRTAASTPPTTRSAPITDDASDPEALARCEPQETEARLVAAFSTTAGRVESWMASGGPGGGALPSSWTTGLTASAPVSVCFVDGPFHVGGPPGVTEAAENRKVSFVDDTGREVVMAIGPVDKLPIMRP